MKTLIEDLEHTIKGEVRFDKYTRLLYSTDASIYEIEPIGVVIPKDREDVVKTIQIANEHNVPILPRGGGTSLAGQAVGHALVIDMSKYMNAVLELNTEERWVCVQPGVVLDELNAYLRPYGLLFPPDTATGNRANIGGLIGNNSCGARSIIYGKTIDYATELSVILSNGEETVFKAVSEEQFEMKMRGQGLEGQVYREVKRIVETNREEILRRYPKILRRVGGYNLDEFVKDGPWNLSKIVVGSEGTLATVVEARLDLLPRPTMTVLDVVHFRDLIEAMEATITIVEHGPAAVELLDKMILDLTKDSLEYSRRMTFVEGDPEAILIVEFYGESRGELEAKIERMEADLRRRGLGTAFVRAFSGSEQTNIWKVRKAGLGLLLGMKGDHKPMTFVEDSAVAVEDLPEYIRRFRKIVEDHGTRAAFYAHSSVGLLHIRPILNLKAKEDVQRMRLIAEEIRDLVLEYGGAMSGEHGDGLARSCWNEKMFGPQIYRAFKEVKAAFDPRNLMNPGKIVDAPMMTENLRYGETYGTIEVKTFFTFAKEGGFARAVELCNGVGLCRKMLEGTMCPSYMVTREEEHSTRGRANLLRAVLSGRLPPDELTGERLYSALDLCLECKGCKGECPSNVDMAKLKYEFLARYYEQHGVPLRAKMFGRVERLNQIGSALAPVSNWVMGSRLARWMLDRFVGIDRRRIPPTFVRETFEKWFEKRNGKKRVGERENGRTGDKMGRGGKGVAHSGHEGRQVVLFHDCFMNYNYPEVGKAAVYLLEAAGFEVILPEKRCCGRPMISKGMLREAREHALYNIDCLSEHSEHGTPIVGCEPSCILTFRDEYPDMVPGKKAQLVASQSFMIDELLNQFAEKHELNLSFKKISRKILVHGHCHQKALIGTNPMLNVLRMLPGGTVEEIDSGCCGMAGSFGYEKEHYEISLEVGKRRLFKAIQDQEDDVEIVAPGVSCRQQIAHGTGRKAKHPVEVLAEALK
ncbi:MAG: anaerobic glycerol-3-phosphate dehydrogenase subunit C [Candidatus Latescibacteria bacterium]|nr:anaerobic glycerol-3-phosphate dehydrogenase subunit C [Candidatus Latescibacterota bacterium]